MKTEQKAKRNPEWYQLERRELISLSHLLQIEIIKEGIAYRLKVPPSYEMTKLATY